MKDLSVSAANPLAVKLQIAARGVRLTDDLLARLDDLCLPQTRLDGSRALEIFLPENLTVTTVVDDAATSALLLSGSPENLHLEVEGGRLPVRVDLPKFYRRQTSSQRPMSQVATAHGSVLVIHPVATCGFGLRGTPCRFCRAGTPVTAAETAPIAVSDVVETVSAAYDEGRGSVVYFNTGYLGGEDGGIAFLEPYIRAVKRNVPAIVVVQLHPPKTNGWIDRTYAMGVDAISYGVEIVDPSVLQRQCPGRVRFIGRDRYYEALAYAASIFPRGTVWSELVAGLESAESTRAGMQALVRDGVLPVLTALRTQALLQLPGVAAAPVEGREILALCRDMHELVRQAGIPMTWIRDLSFAVTPLEARWLVGDGVPMATGWESFYRSRLGNMAARNLSRLRRRLRVRQTDTTSPLEHE